MKKDELLHDMTEGPLLKQMLRFALPFVLANLLQTVYTLTDLAIVGRFSGSAGLAAVSISGQVTIFLTLVGTAFASGGQIYVAQLVGQGRRDELGGTVGTLLTTVTLLSLAVAALGAGLCRTALGWLNTPAEAMEPATDYLVICSVGMIFVYGYNAVCAVLRGMGESKAPTVFVAVAAAVNVAGDLILVALLNMGARGAAWATALSQLAALLLSLLYLFRRRGALGFDFRPRSFAVRRDKLLTMGKLALPLVVMQCAINLSMLFVSAYINAFGVAASSLAGVGNKLYSVMSMVSGAFGTAMATVTGQNIGAGRPDRVRQAAAISVGINLAFLALVTAVIMCFPREVFRLFTDDEAVLDMAARYFGIAFWVYLSFSLMSTPIGVINGVGNTALNLVIALLDGVAARIGLSLWLGGAYGMWGYFTGNALAGFVSVILCWLYVFSGRWQRRKLLE